MKSIKFLWVLLPVLFLLSGCKEAETDSAMLPGEDVIAAYLTVDDGEFPSCDGTLQLGNKRGPVQGAYGYSEYRSNVDVKPKGDETDEGKQDLKFSVKKGRSPMDGMEEFTLKKYVKDPLRITDQLMQDMMAEIPGMMSARTKLVHLYVKENGKKADPNRKFKDYGIYTLTESIDEKFLENRGLEAGALYKAKDVIEAAGGIAPCFDEENLYSYLAFHILTGNVKAADEDFYLYTPEDNEKFYLISRNCSGAFREVLKKIEDPEYQCIQKKGIYAYTDSVLFSWVFKDPDSLATLTEYVDMLHDEYLTSEGVAERLEELTDATRDDLYRLPDRIHMRVTEDVYNEIAASIPEAVEEYYRAYHESIEGVWPFHLQTPEVKDGKLVLNWEDAYCAEGEVRYTVEVDDGWNFEDSLVYLDNVRENSVVIDALPAGSYFLRLTAESPTGITTPAIENYYTEKKTTVYGVLYFYVTLDGKAVASFVKNQE